MAFGIESFNNNDQILFSDSSYTLEFIGKATLRTDIGYHGFSLTYGSNPYARYYNYYGTTLWDLPFGYALGYYDIEANAQDLIAFSYVPVNDVFTGIVYQHQQTSTTTRFYVMTQGVTNINNDPFAPQVYCFRKISPKANNGSGIQLFDASGNISFTTQANVLMPKAGSLLNVQASRLSQGVISQFYYYSNNNGVNALNVQNHSLINPTSMSKPAICFYAPGTGIANDIGGVEALMELGIRYNNVSNVLQTQWATTGTVYTGYGTNKNMPAYQTFAMMIDGADYD